MNNTRKAPPGYFRQLNSQRNRKEYFSSRQARRKGLNLKVENNFTFEFSFMFKDKVFLFLEFLNYLEKSHYNVVIRGKDNLQKYFKTYNEEFYTKFFYNYSVPTTSSAINLIMVENYLFECIRNHFKDLLLNLDVFTKKLKCDLFYYNTNITIQKRQIYITCLKNNFLHKDHYFVTSDYNTICYSLSKLLVEKEYNFNGPDDIKQVLKKIKQVYEEK